MDCDGTLVLAKNVPHNIRQRGLENLQIAKRIIWAHSTNEMGQKSLVGNNRSTV